MKKYCIFLLTLLLLFAFPITTKAETIIKADDEYVDPFEGMELLSQTTKYYKVLYYYDTNGKEVNNKSKIIKTEEFEITEEEYNKSEVIENYTKGIGTVETNYKRMISSIGKVGSNYRYVNSLSWKKMPAVRSYDIIGIGFLSTVEPASTPNFNITYTYTGGGSGTYAFKVFNTFNKGVSCTFEMPTSTNVNSINMQFWVDVKKKNSGATLSYQAAYADYAHATSSVSLIHALNHTVNQSAGIVHDSSVAGYYDTMAVAGATWTGTW